MFSIPEEIRGVIMLAKSLMIDHLTDRKLKVPEPASEPDQLIIRCLQLSVDSIRAPWLGTEPSARLLIVIFYLQKIMQAEWSNIREEVLSNQGLLTQIQNNPDEHLRKRMDELALSVVVKMQNLETLDAVQTSLLRSIINQSNIEQQVGLTEMEIKKELLIGLKDALQSHNVPVNCGVKI